ncbi:MAG TPA: hypothetical protein VNI01_11895 [Elusimicrobiota bacterium]|nr:hypothetical protein [Elusimicrobiota bacterium]
MLRPESFKPSKRESAAVLSLFAASALARLAYIWRNYFPLRGDAGIDYQSCALHFLANGWLDRSLTCTGHPPGWPLLLALEYKVFGVRLWVGLIGNLLLNLAGMAAAARLAWELGGKRAAWIALLVGAFYYDSFYWSETLMSDHAFNFLVGLGALCLIRPEEPKRSFLGAFVLGCATWFRALTQPLWFLLPACALARRGWNRQGLSQAGIFLLAFSMAVLPRVARDSYVHRHLVTSSTFGGWQFWASNGPASNGSSTDLSPQDPKYLVLPEWKRDKVFFHEGLLSLRKQPLSMILKRELFKLLGTLYPFLPEYDARFAFVLPSFAFMCPFFVWAFLHRRRFRGDWTYLYLLLANFTLIVLVFNGNPRNRTPINWLVVAVGAAGLDALWRQSPASRRRILGWACANVVVWGFSDALRVWLKSTIHY